MNIAMISASGFVGSAIFRELIERKLTVKAMVRISPALQMNPGTSGKRTAKQPTGFDTPVEDNNSNSIVSVDDVAVDIYR